MLIFCNGSFALYEVTVQPSSNGTLDVIISLFTTYYKISAQHFLQSVTDQHWNILQGLEWMFLMNKHCQTIPPFNVICFNCQSLETLLFARFICFEWFGNVSLKWTEVSAELTIDCRVPDLQHCHVELLLRSPAHIIQKGPKKSPIGKDTRLLR